MCLVRPIELQDARRVAEIQVDAWRFAYSDILPEKAFAHMTVDLREQAWKKIITSSGVRQNKCIEDDGDIVGWAGIGMYRGEDKDSARTQELYGLYVDPKKFRAGYGGKLWKESLETMLEENPQQITLWVLAENARAIAFYESEGFSADGESKRMEHLGGAEEIRMVLEVDD